MGNAGIKLLTSQAKFQSDQDYFQCPAVARGLSTKLRRKFILSFAIYSITEGKLQPKKIVLTSPYVFGKSALIDSSFHIAANDISTEF